MMIRVLTALSAFTLISCESEIEPYKVPKGGGVPYLVTLSEDRNGDGKADYTVMRPADAAACPPGAKTIFIDTDHDGFFDQARVFDEDGLREEVIDHHFNPVFGLASEGGKHPRKMVRHYGSVGGVGFEVTISQGEYDFSKHTFTGGIGNSPDPAKLDGIELAGTDGGQPYWGDNPERILEAITEIKLAWGEEVVEVPKKLHLHFLQLHLDEYGEWKTLQFIPKPSGDEILMQAIGGDGGASYLASLIFRKDGQHRQSFQYWEEGLPNVDDAWDYTQ